jgi:hypothetical protein
MAGKGEEKEKRRRREGERGCGSRRTQVQTASWETPDRKSADQGRTERTEQRGEGRGQRGELPHRREMAIHRPAAALPSAW